RPWDRAGERPRADHLPEMVNGIVSHRPLRAKIFPGFPAPPPRPPPPIGPPYPTGLLQSEETPPEAPAHCAPLRAGCADNVGGAGPPGAAGGEIATTQPNVGTGVSCRSPVCQTHAAPHLLLVIAVESSPAIPRHNPVRVAPRRNSGRSARM